MYEKKPFHESVVPQIQLATTVAEMYRLAELLLTTKVPENHDAIAEAWQVQVNKIFPDTPADLGVVSEVVADLRRQEQAAKEKTRDAALVGALAHDGEDRYDSTRRDTPVPEDPHERMS